MRNEKGGGIMVAECKSLHHRPKFGNLLHSDPALPTLANAHNDDDHNYHHHSNINNHDYTIRHSSASATSPPGRYFDSVQSSSTDSSPYVMSPYHASPYNKSPWIMSSPLYLLEAVDDEPLPQNGLIGSLVREEGHIYSLAVNRDLLYTGSDSKNIRVWKNLKDFTGFKSNSGLVKTIVISSAKIFTGHQDGKIRVWKVSPKNPSHHRRVGSLPTLKDFIRSSLNPKNYVEVRRHRNVVRIRHFDAVSCMSLCEEEGLLYSGSWDKTLKVWRIADSKCLESINTHDDALNSIVVGFDSLVFTGSADGKMKVWRREMQNKGTTHFLIHTLLQQENAVTALAVNMSSGIIYCGSSDGLVNYWERKKYMQLTHSGVLRGHKQAVLCLAAAGNLVFSGSADSNICVWRKEEGQCGVHTCLSVLTGHKGPVKCLTVVEDQGSAEDNKAEQRWIVYSGSLDRSVKVWRVMEQGTDLRQIKALERDSTACSPRGNWLRCS